MSARDLLHLAVARRVGCGSIVAADRDFEGLPDIGYLDPLEISQWRNLMVSE
jgi:predicted nucleic acid-binding protein